MPESADGEIKSGYSSTFVRFHKYDDFPAFHLDTLQRLGSFDVEEMEKVRTVIFLIVLTFVLGSQSDEITETNLTWDATLTMAKSEILSMMKPRLQFLMRSVSEADVSSSCESHLLKFTMDISKLETWAIRMFDASGKMPSGILDGTIMDFGSYEECLKIKVIDSSKYSRTKGEELFRGRYCMVGYHSPLISPLSQKTPDGKSYVEAYGTPPELARDIFERSGVHLKRIAFWFGTCVPSTCTGDDLKRILTVATRSLGFNISVMDCKIDEPFEWPTYSIAAVSCLGCLATLCAVGTFIDVVSRWRKSNPRTDESDHLLLRIPKAFSFYTNTENLFCRNVEGGSLSCFNGIRFLSATWIILGHTYFFTDTWKYLKYRHLFGFEEQFNRYLPVAAIENATIPVGSFFFMSGFLLVYSTWRVLEKNEGKLNLLVFLIRKFWRMTPALGLTLALLFSMPVIDAGPIWDSTLRPQLTQCRNLWWANFLFINNWWSTDEYCLIHTWYLAALMQFHIVGILLLLLAYRWPFVGVFTGSVISAGCAVITALLVIKNDYPMPALGSTKDKVIDDYNSQIYIKPFAHIMSYLIGMCLGYIILKYHDRKLAPKYQVLGWTLAVIGGLTSVYGLYGPAGHISIRIMYIIGCRIGWALSIGWMIYACATGAGGIVNRILSWSALYPLGQLSYLTYLLHPLVLIYRDASLRERVYYGNTELVFSILSVTVVSIFLAYIGYVIVEMPFAILEKIVFKNKTKNNFEKMDQKENPHAIVSSVKTLKNP